MEIEENVELENQENNTNDINLDSSENTENVEVDDVNTGETTEDTEVSSEDISQEISLEDLILESGTESITITAPEMTSSYIVLSSTHLIISIVLILVILKQSKNATGISSGNELSQTYWAKNKGNSQESKLAKVTVVLAVVFFILTLAISLI